MLPSFDAIDRNVTEARLTWLQAALRDEQLRLMGAGDILLLHTDGLSDHRRGEEEYAPHGSRRRFERSSVWTHAASMTL